MEYFKIQTKLFSCSTGIDRLYALSFLWMREVATSITIIVAVILSLLTGELTLFNFDQNLEKL